MGRKNPYKIRLANGLVVRLVVSNYAAVFEIDGRILSKFSRDPRLMENAEEITKKFYSVWEERSKACMEMAEPIAKVYAQITYNEKKISKGLYRKFKTYIETLVKERDQANMVCQDDSVPSIHRWRMR